MILAHLNEGPSTKITNPWLSGTFTTYIKALGSLCWERGFGQVSLESGPGLYELLVQLSVPVLEER